MAAEEGDNTNTRGNVRRSRYKYAALMITVILLGLASRSYSPPLPPVVKAYAGDALWALAAYMMIAFLFPRLPIRSVAAWAGLFSLAVEVSQLYHATWIDNLRRMRVGGLVLGYGFLWSDLVCYVVGISTGVLAEILLGRQRPSYGRPPAPPRPRSTSQLR